MTGKSTEKTGKSVKGDSRSTGKIVIRDMSEKPANYYRNVHPDMPVWPSRTLLIGPSGSGKTNALLNMIYHYLSYDNIFLYLKNGEQEEYMSLIDKLNEASEELDRKPIIHFGRTIDDIVPLEELNHKEQNLLIFDDFVTDKSQGAIIDMFVRSRHKNCTIFYLSQSYSLTPINIRRNINYCLFFKLARGRDLGLIHSDMAVELSKEKFKQIFVNATKEKYSFFMVDMVNPEKKYRSGLSTIIHVD